MATNRAARLSDSLRSGFERFTTEPMKQIQNCKKFPSCMSCWVALYCSKIGPVCFAQIMTTANDSPDVTR